MLRGKRPDRKGQAFMIIFIGSQKIKKERKKQAKQTDHWKKSESSKKARVVTAGRGPGETSEG